MKKSVVALALATTIMAISVPAAAKITPTFSVGYSSASASVSGGIKATMPGANVTVLLEADNGFGAVISGTYARKNTGDLDALRRLSYLNIAAGPSYRFLDYFTLYGNMGVSMGNARWFESAVLSTTDGVTQIRITSHRVKRAAFGYGVGIMITPIEHFAINLAYTGSDFSSGNSKLNVNSWVFGVGYRF